MNYVINTNFGCKVFQDNTSIEKQMSTMSYIQNLCHQHLFTYQGYLKACRKTLGFKYKIPLYLSESLQLVALKSVRDYDAIWVNCARIKGYHRHSNGVCIIFKDESSLIASISEKTLKTQIERLITIKEVKIKQFYN